MFENARVLVTGGAGFVGANLVQRMLELGAQVTATLHHSPPVINDERIKYVTCDLTKADDCQNIVQNTDYVFMCASKTAGAGLMQKAPLSLFAPNLLMNISMLQAAYGAGVKNLLFISGSAVYPVSDSPVREQDACFDFFDKYFIEAWMKRFSEVACEIYATRIRNPMDITLVRPANLYGEFDNYDLETSHVIPALIRKVVERHDPIEIWGDGNDIKDFLHIQDFIDGMLLAMQKLSRFEPINIASGRPHSINDIVTMLLEIDKFPDAKIKYNMSKPTMIPRRMMDTSKARSQIDFETKIDLRSGLARTLSWYRDNCHPCVASS